MQGRWLGFLGRFQDALLFVWLAHVCFVPQHFSSLVNFFGLAALWVLMLLLGGWHLAKVPAKRGLAAWTMAAFPLAFLIVTVLDSTVDVPLVGPPAGRWLFFGALSVFPLYWLARWLDSNIAGSMATMTGVFFLLALFLAPDQGLISQAFRRRRCKQRFALEMLVVHLSRHEGTAEEASECSVQHLTEELNWEQNRADKIVSQATRLGLVERQNGHLDLTPDGYLVAEQVLSR